MASLFISYSRKDIESARKLTEAFKGQDLDFWIDWEGIPPTVDWWKEIEKGIEEADIFLFLLSPDSCKSNVCQREIEHAANNGKRLIPVVVQDVKADESPENLRHLNWIFLREIDEFDTAFGKLITAIKTDYVWVQIHRELQMKALEWERSTRENSFLLHGKELRDAEGQLVANASKEPHPTDLQRDYVLKSRQVSDRQRRITMGVAIAGLIALATLAIFGFAQAGLATTNARKEQAASTLAFSNANTAEAASTLAFDNASTAQANADEAERQSQIALARQLAAQAQTINATQNSNQMIAALLAVQSMKLFPTSEGAQVLLNDNAAVPVQSRVIHDYGVYVVAFSPDGKYIVSGSEDSTARVSETATGKEVARMTHNLGVTSVAFSADGNYVVSGDWEGTARVWEAFSGKEVIRMDHEEWVAALAFSPDGNYVVSGGGNGTARVWEALTGHEITRMVFEGDVLSLSFSPDGRHVISGQDSGVIHVWEALTGREVFHISLNDIVWAVAYSPDGGYVASQSDDNIARVWETSTGKEVARLTHPQSPSRGGGGTSQLGRQTVAFSPDSKYIVSGSETTACMLEIASNREIACVNHDAAVNSVVFSPNGDYVVSGSVDGTARVWLAATREEVARMTHDGAVNWIGVAPNGKHIVSGSWDGTARVWKTDLEHELPRWRDESMILAFGPEESYVATNEESDTVHIRDFSSGIEIARIHHAQVENADFSEDGKRLFTMGGDGMIRVWETLSGREIASLRHEGVFGFVFFSPDGNHVISKTEDRTVRIWEAVTGRNVTYDDVTEALAFSPDGQHMATGHWNRTAIVWEISSGREVAHVTHGADVRAVTFSPDGRYVVSAACDEPRKIEPSFSCTSTIRVWEALTGKQVAHMIHTDVVTSFTLSPNGNYLLSGACVPLEDRRSCSQPSVRLWETFTGRELLQTVNFNENVGFSPSGNYVLSMNSPSPEVQRMLTIWEVSSGRKVASIRYEGSLESIDFGPDEKYFVGGGTDRTARVWEVSGGREIARMTHDEWVRSVAFSPDGQFVVSAADNDTIRIWEAMSGREVGRVLVDNLVDSLAFSEDGRFILWTNDNLPRSRLWQPTDLIADACARLPRNLARAEWQQYIGDALPYQAICPNLPIEPEALPTAVTVP